MEVNHKDLNRVNPRLENLEYITHMENIAHAKSNGHWPWGDRHGSSTHPESRPRGEKIGSHKISEKDVREIRKLAASGMFQREIGILFSLDQSSVSDVVNRKTWFHIV